MRAKMESQCTQHHKQSKHTKKKQQRQYVSIQKHENTTLRTVCYCLLSEFKKRLFFAAEMHPKAQQSKKWGYYLDPK